MPNPKVMYMQTNPDTQELTGTWDDEPVESTDQCYVRLDIPAKRIVSVVNDALARRVMRLNLQQDRLKEALVLLDKAVAELHSACPFGSGNKKFICKTTAKARYKARKVLERLDRVS